MTADQLFQAIQTEGPDLAAGVPFSRRLDEFERRWPFVSRFGFAVPSREAIGAIRDFAGGGLILDVGSGAALWPFLLRSCGANVVATDPEFDGLSVCDTMEYLPLKIAVPFLSVERLEARQALAKYQPEVLMFIWPCYESSWPYEALKLYHGAKVVYVGEGEGGCTANDDFHRALADHWTIQQEVAIPRWFGIHDSVRLYTRK